jgi:hypothetical protein
LGVSIIQHKYSYGFVQGLWELALINNKKEILTWNSPIGDGVWGYLTEERVNEILMEIKNILLL